MRALGILLAVLCATTHAAPVVQVRIAGPAADTCRSGASIIAVASAPQLQRELKIDSNQELYEISLPDATAWELRLRKEGCWSERATWSAGDSVPVVLRVYKAAAVHSSFQTERRVNVSRLSARVHLQDKQRESSDAFEDASCTVSDLRWRCAVPADTPFDLRLEVPTFAAVHYWDVLVGGNAGEWELDPQRLRSGASVGGWVHDPGDAPLRDARVTLFPLDMVNHSRDHVAARLTQARTNARGFFQLSALAPGQYRLVSEARGYSPVIVTEVAVRAGESITLPRPIRHAALSEARVVLDPPLDPRNEEWTVELTEAIPLFPGRRPRSVTAQAGMDGGWSAAGLRADLYEVEVRNSNGSAVHRGSVDLFGGPQTVHLALREFAVRGVVRAGNLPLHATVQFHQPANADVKAAQVTTDADGRFEITLPAAGEWMPTILAPPGPAAARVAAQPFEILKDAPAGAVHEVVVQLPGGRIFGRVVGEDGKTGRAAVHAVRGVEISAQQMADAQGKFDLIGLRAGTYLLDAQNETGSTAEAVEVHIEEGESREVELVTARTVRVSGFVLTPDGRPASGAIVRMSDDGGHLWSNWITDIRGRFEREVRRGLTTIQAIVLSHDYPGTIVTIPVREEPIRIQLRNDGGILRFDFQRQVRGAYVSARGVTAPYNMFFFPQPPGRFGGGIYLEAGAYVLCPRRVMDEQCRNVTLSAGQDRRVELDDDNSAGG